MVHPRYFAEQILDTLAINGPEELKFLDQIAWERKALVREIPIEGAEARLTMMGRRAIIAVSTFISDIHRKRFSVAHELGHWEMHRDKSSLSICLNSDINEGYSKILSAALEQEANEFASALLMPERFFAPQCKKQEPSFEHIAELATQFNTSLTATSLRYLQFCDEPITFVFSEDNRIKWYKGNKCFEELGVRIETRSSLDPLSRAAAAFKGHTLLSQMKPVKASAWFAPGKYRSDASVQEQSRPMPKYNAVLTLLWVDDDIEDDESY